MDVSSSLQEAVNRTSVKNPLIMNLITRHTVQSTPNIIMHKVHIVELPLTSCQCLVDVSRALQESSITAQGVAVVEVLQQWYTRVTLE